MLDEAVRSAVAILDELRSAGFVYEATQAVRRARPGLAAHGRDLLAADVISSLQKDMRWP